MEQLKTEAGPLEYLELRTEAGPPEYLDAFKVVRLAKNVLMVIILLSILVQLGGVILVEFVGLPSAPATSANEAAAGVPAASGPTQTTDPSPLRTTVFWLLPATKFTALAACLLLVLTLMFSVKLSLVGRLGGIAGFVRAFFLSLILLAMLVPWQQIVKATFACGALFNLDQLEEARRKLQDNTLAQILHYARFIAYPLLAMLVLAAVQITFSKGCRKMSIPPAAVSGRPEGPQQRSC